MQPNSLRVVELTRSVAGAVCGRLFVGLGHDVTLCEPEAGHALRSREHTFTATAAGKRSVMCDPAIYGALWNSLLAEADVLIIDVTASEAVQLGIDSSSFAERFPRLITVSLTPFGLESTHAHTPADSFLAEAYGGLVHMVGEPDLPPLSLGGQQAAHAAAFVGLLGASLALRRRQQTGAGEHVDVVLSDVAAYMDWKSDVAYALTHVAPHRTGASRGLWRVVEARDGWVGVIFLAHQWRKFVELIGDSRLDDPSLLDPRVRQERIGELWPVVEEAIRRRDAHEVYVSAQDLGLPFGYAATATDLLESEQLRLRGFVVDSEERRRDAPVLAFPLPEKRVKTVERAPEPGQHDGIASSSTAVSQVSAANDLQYSGDGPLAGVVVVDFGTITAGAATTRILADYGATVIKIESNGRPDGFRQWVMPGSGAAASETSPMFESNNVGKLGLCVDLKTEDGRNAVRELIRHADVLVENFRAGVTTRLGIDPHTVHALNPDLIYLSLSSQGSAGPEAEYGSYGSTLDLLSGLGGVTGYVGGGPIWSSGEVNYPDQIVALAGAAFVTHAVANGCVGTHLDVSQRELVAWTLADQLADHVWDGVPMEPTGNRRPYSTPHDVYPSSDRGWVAIACSTSDHRRALATVISGLPSDQNAQWWRENQDDVDITIARWTASKVRDDAVAALRAANVPAVPVCTAVDRAAQEHYRKRRVSLSDNEGGWLKGFPLVLRSYAPPQPRPAPALTDDIADSRSPQFDLIFTLIRDRDVRSPSAEAAKSNNGIHRRGEAHA
ncbi:CaiB/BaiF CoA-transferase family protein [Rhodococcoides fascians]|uniref:CaiB/BaiF CoA-transferase family protein n=1 Tax=Rhodococcoides fascians TaxID=1828 RepID=UPI00055A07EA|nr:CoA transferase [Rhodococcus fascians]